MDKKMRQTLGLITFTVFLFAAVMNFHEIMQLLQNVFGVAVPLLVGGILAFVLSVPMNGFEKMFRKLFEKSKKRPSDKIIHWLSFVLTFVSIGLILVLVCTIAIPQIVSSMKGIGALVRRKWPEYAMILKSYHIDTTPIAEWLETLDFEHLFANLANYAGVLLDVLAGTAASTVSVIVTGGIALVVMFHMLLTKDDLARQSKKILYAYTKTEVADKVLYVGRLIRDTYSKFLSGQCVESIILGCLMFLAFKLFRLPYAGLVAMLTGVCAFIPYIGAFVSCGVGVFLTLLVNPIQAVVCLVVYQAVQFIENQFIYPRVVGSSVGLSPLWTLAAALVGGKLLGLFGMIFFIPLTAVIYTLLRTDVNKRLKEKIV